MLGDCRGEALALRLGLTKDQHEQLLHVTAKHLGTSATASDAVLSAATELGIDQTAALQLAAYAADMFDAPGAPAAEPPRPVVPPRPGEGRPVSSLVR